MNKIQKPCAICGKLFTPKTVNSLYCSKKCGEAAYRKKKSEQKKAEQFKIIADNVPSDRPFISIPEAIAIYGVAKSTLYRLIRQGEIPAINLGTRLLRISRTEIEQMFPMRQQSKKTVTEIQPAKLYNLEPENCYCINDISEKFGISPSTVYAHIRKYSIPTRQIGSFVYAPKSEIDSLYNNKK